MADPFSGAALEVGMEVVLKGALEIFLKGYQFGSTLEEVKETLNCLTTEVEKIKKLNAKLDRPTEETERLETLVRDAKEHVDKYSKINNWWRFPCFPCYQCRLEAKDKALKRHLTMVEPVLLRRELLMIRFKIENSLQTLLMKEENICGAIEEPECIGMDEHLHKLKNNLLKDDVSVLVLTGLGGSGKTTLAKKICYDPQIKGKFGVNIFFVTVSEKPNLKTIVGTLFKRFGRPVPEFQSNGDATIQLKDLLWSVGGNENPILLVLDDVWPSTESEALVEAFNIRIPNYKILVTSRVALPKVGIAFQLGQLDHNQAVDLFSHYAKLNDNNSSYMPEEDLLDQIVRLCMGSPLALKVTAGSLCRRPFEIWKNMQQRLQSQTINTDLLCRLQQSLDMLEDDFPVNEKVCFKDLGLFPEDQRIPVPALIDMWAELHNLNDDGSNAMAIVHNLTDRNFINFIVTRKVAKDEDMYYNNHFVILHDLLRELAIDQSRGEPFEQRERLTIDLTGDARPEWWVGQNQQGIIGRMFSFCPRMQKHLKVAARILSISTDEAFNSDWCDMQPYKAEVLILNLRSSQYSLPRFTKKMSKLKVLIVTNYGFHRSELNKFKLLGSLPNLKRVRLEKVSVPSLCILKNLLKLSLHMCSTRQAFESGSIQISDAMPNLVEMSIDYCSDLVKLPNGLCKITPLKKLSITNCHKLSALPQDIAELENLEVLRLCCCSALVGMPGSVKGLNKLSCLDISDCVSLTQLPDDIGELKKLKKLYMKGCSQLSGLPYSVDNFVQLQQKINVICDEETAALWVNFRASPNFKIEIFREEIGLNWLLGVHS